ncbi:hypothetical protein IM660_01685 [Ruania alkalisoli]|uniref:Uncharacterized protein n=1 Tax=Ruania alkalisoli TaxID=2779775 RepID=A0A7M1SU89_9MICO|nr:hypothetical protein [Ruania alkalisoli]QOR71051.1 hypothetical protein IM660_01685 [Ruania alkalisoli]
MLIRSTSEIEPILAQQRPWRRVLETLRRLAESPERISDGAARSVGDAATYRLLTAADVDSADLVRHRRYHDAFAVLDGVATLEVAPADWLTVVRSYRDTDDTELLSGAGTVVQIGAGQMGVLAIDEAVRVVELEGRCVLWRVTVEGSHIPST